MCGAGHSGWTPADDTLGLGPEHFTPALARLVIEQAIDRPFDEVPATVESVWNVLVYGERSAKSRSGWDSKRNSGSKPRLPPSRPGDRAIRKPDCPEPEALMVAADGAMVHFREDHAWHDVKVGVAVPLALSGSFRPGVLGIELASPDYYVGVESRAEFWSRMEARAV